MSDSINSLPDVLKRSDITEFLRISKATFYRGLPDFPAPIEISPGSRCLRWLKDDFIRWMESRQKT